jgi:hypothetical protein
MGGKHGSGRASSLALRFKVKGAGIVGFLLASLHSWWVHQGGEHGVAITQHRGLLEQALDPQQAVGVAPNDTSRYGTVRRDLSLGSASMSAGILDRNLFFIRVSVSCPEEWLGWSWW